MTNAELKEAFIKEFAYPPEELAVRHPSLFDLGAKFIDYTEDGRLIISYPLKPEQRNGYQLLQGGYIATFIDNNYGIYSYVATGAKSMPTIDLSVNYHKGVLEDEDTLTVTTYAKSVGKRILSMAGEARNAKGQLVASSQTNMLNATGTIIAV